MPTYSYICSNCKHEAEFFQKINDDELTTCPKCKKETFSRKIGGSDATFQFKGDGFYCKDYKKKDHHDCSNCNCKKNK